MQQPSLLLKLSSYSLCSKQMMKRITLSPIMTFNFLCPRWLLSIMFKTLCQGNLALEIFGLYFSVVSTKLYPCCHYAAILIKSPSFTSLEMQSENAKLTSDLRIFCLQSFYSFFLYQTIKQVATIAVSAKGKDIT